MYGYFPNKRFGEDKVARITWITGSQGDLFLVDGEYVVLLGEDITAHELIQGQFTAVHTASIQPWLCTDKSMQLIHHFVWMRYTSYAHTIPLWIGADILALLKRRSKKGKQAQRAWKIELSAQSEFVFSTTTATWRQQLLVFPDLWTMHQQLPARLFEQGGVARRHSGLSVLQKAAIYWWCKQWTIHTLITTPAWIFQDWLDVESIILVDAHKWWYKSVQDPRYRTPTVISAFRDKFSCDVMTSGVLLTEDAQRS